jgi:hypothetical protein
MQERIRTMLAPEKLIARPAIRLNLRGRIAYHGALLLPAGTWRAVGHAVQSVFEEIIR